MDVVLTGVQPDEIALNPVEAGTAGDSRIAASVEALFREHYGRIVGMLARLTGDRAHSEEIASDVFHKLSQRPALLESREDLTAWIYRVATNAGFDALRTNSRRRKREEAAGLRRNSRGGRAQRPRCHARRGTPRARSLCAGDA